MRLRFYLSLVFSILLLLPLFSQEVDSVSTKSFGPKKGINELALTFYSINFSKEQRSRLEGVELEFIFMVDEYGKPELREVNGINDQYILDSLKTTASTLDYFYPFIDDNGVPTPNLYFMKLAYPSYQMNVWNLGLLNVQEYNEADYEDFQEITENDFGFDMVIGGYANGFVGRPAQHLGVGGGMKLETDFVVKDNYLFGLNMSVCGNRLIEEYPISSNRMQLKAPATALLGLILGKRLERFWVQLELNYISQNLTENQGDDDPDWIQIEGWSPGLVIHWPIEIGRPTTLYYYGAPSVWRHHIDIHYGLRFVDYSLKEASGIMMDLGVSYRWGIRAVSSYKLRE